MKKPKLSEIVAFQKNCPLTTMDEVFQFDNCAYLLDLVERMGRVIRDDVNPISEIDTIRVRILLEELRN